MPVLIFAIAFGLSMDYEVFLLSRIKENYDRTGDTVQAVATGVQRTGSIITSAALLLVVVIGALHWARYCLSSWLEQACALAIFVDATIVRLLLVAGGDAAVGQVQLVGTTPAGCALQEAGHG